MNEIIEFQLKKFISDSKYNFPDNKFMENSYYEIKGFLENEYLGQALLNYMETLINMANIIDDRDSKNAIINKVEFRKDYNLVRNNIIAVYNILTDNTIKEKTYFE